MRGQPISRREGALGETLREPLHVLVLTGLAVAQPLYSLLAGHPGFFVVRRSEPVDVLILAGVASFLLPGALAGLLALVRRLHRGTGTLCHRLVVGLLVAALALQVLGRFTGLPGAPAVAAAVCLGAGAAVAYHRSSNVRLFASLLTPAVAVFPAVFLLHPSVSKIVRPPPVDAIAAVEIPAPAPMLFVVFDALPVTSLMNESGAIDPVRFPSFARLAATATWYRNATTVSGSTLYALPAILTGNRPDGEWQPSFYDHPRNLFTFLGKSHELELFEHLTDLCPAELCPRAVAPLAERLAALASDLSIVFLHVLLPPDLTASLPQISQTWKDFAGTRPGKRNRHQKLDLFLEAIDGRPRPTLYFLHSLFPHAPYQYLPSGTRYTRSNQDIDPRILHRGRWSRDRWAVRQSHRRHLLQAGFVDTVLGQILERFRQLDLFDRALIVVTADHGVSFRPGDFRRKPTASNFLDVLPVPLLIKRPHQTAGAIDDRNVETIDILPTVAELLGAELPWPTDGVSAVRPSRPERPTKTCLGRPPLVLPNAAFAANLDAVRSASEAFGSGDFSTLLRAGPHQDVVGRELGELGVAASGDGVAAYLADPSLFSGVDPDSGLVPALIEGYAELPPERPGPVDLAIAVNGIVRATTRTHLEPQAERRFAWSALAADDVFRPGANEIEVLVLREAGQTPRLVPTATGARRTPYSGIRLGAEPVSGVEEAGFHEPEALGDATIRWTTDAAKLVVPVDPVAPPRALRLDLAYTGKRDNELTVAISGQRLFHGRLPPGSWSRTFDLAGVAWANEAVLELRSGVFVPAEVSDSADRRVLGVAVSGIWLDPD